MALLTYPSYLVGAPAVGGPGAVHSSQKMALGTRRFDVEGREYIYLKGVGSTLYGSWVIFDELYATALMDDGVVEVGNVAIATAAVDATTEYGWYVIYGLAEGLCLADFADNGIVFNCSTAGSVDDADTAAGLIVGAVGRSDRDTTTGTALFQLSYPTNGGADLHA